MIVKLRAALGGTPEQSSSPETRLCFWVTNDYVFTGRLDNVDLFLTQKARWSFIDIMENLWGGDEKVTINLYCS